MKFSSIALVAAFAAQEVAAHATFQELWINGVDQGGVCARLPTSNSPIQDVTSNNLRCNINTPAQGKCAVKAGDTVTIEMHQQPGDRSCSEQAIGGAHYGPVLTYMTKVSDSSTADGSTGWFKVFQDTWAKDPSGSTGSDDYWGTKDLNNCCGKMDVKIPAGLPSGDYLLRAEAIALHAASSSGGAQFYMTCFQLTVTGSGSDSPATVLFPGAYKATDPGILINIYQSMSSYTAPGPAVVSDGTTKVAGSSYCPVAAGGSGAPTSSVATSPATTTTKATTTVATTMKTSTTTTTSAKTTTTSSGGSTGGNCAAKYAQCGGQGWTGATCCASGSTCTASNQYYSQCL